MTEPTEAYGGLPLPSPDELQRFNAQIEQANNANDDLVDILYNLLNNDNPRLGVVAKKDIDHFKDFENDCLPPNERLDETSLNDFTCGILEGYKYVSALFTHVELERIGEKDPKKYIENIRYLEHKPVASAEELRRTLGHIAGINLLSTEKVLKIISDESELFALEATELIDVTCADAHDNQVDSFLLNAPHLFTAIEYETQKRAQEHGANTDSPIANGFRRGVSNALTMYVLSTEERRVEELEYLFLD